MPESTPEVTEVPSPEPTPTLNYYVELVTPAGEPARIERSISAGDLAIIFLLAVLLVSVWGMYVSHRLGGDVD